MYKQQTEETEVRFLLYSENEDTLVLEQTSQPIATVRQFNSIEFPGAKNLRIDFLKLDEEQSNKSLAPIDLVSYVLNCIAFRCGSEPKCTVGQRHIQLSITDGSNPQPGETRIATQVMLPLITIQRAAELEAFYFVGGSAIAPFAKLATTVPGSTAWEKGWIEFRIVDPMPEESLGLMLSSGGLFFDFKPFPAKQDTPETPREKADADREEGIVWTRSPCLLVETHGAIMGKVFLSKHMIRLRMLPQCNWLKKHLESLIRCVTYENKSVDAGNSKAERTLRATASDEARIGGYNMMEVRVRLGVKISKGKK